MRNRLRYRMTNMTRKRTRNRSAHRWCRTREWWK
jgi:hypothetical protein